MEECESRIENTVSDYLWKMCPPIFICFGLTGNILTILVIKRLGFRKQPTLTFLLCLAISDIFVLCTGLPRYWILYVFQYDLRTASNANCKLYYFFLYLSMHLSSWILVGVTVERLIKAYFPMKYRGLFSYRIVIIGLFVTFVTLVLINGHFFFTNGINNYTEGSCGSLNPDFFFFDENIFIFIDFSIVGAVPFIIMFVCNILLIHVLRTVQKERVSMMHKSVYQHTTRFSVKMTKMLVACTFYFLIATTPISVYMILDTYLLPVYEEENNCVAISRMDLAWSITYILEYSNSCINFYLYTATNDRFYKELKALLRCHQSLRMMRVYSAQQHSGSGGRTLATLSTSHGSGRSGRTLATLSTSHGSGRSGRTLATLSTSHGSGSSGRTLTTLSTSHGPDPLQSDEVRRA
ncbi:C-C chemokine receptor type 1-like [Ruditapes philippinarum]|uniref:C-C chemokine receptor type 1-like n=1 Tax=Ruditapes philippinarum TaxID=129788 RepID=UPI00295ADBBC|nr:C-C chemokine receptor type 1-like [Ruditapes philippinarum]